MFSRRHSHSGDVGIPVFWVPPMFWVFPCFGYPRILSISVFLVFPWFCYPCVFGTPYPNHYGLGYSPLDYGYPKQIDVSWTADYGNWHGVRGLLVVALLYQCKMEDGAWPSGCDKSGRNLWNVFFFFFFFTWSAEICKPTFMYVFRACQEKNRSVLISIPWNPVCLSLYPRNW